MENTSTAKIVVIGSFVTDFIFKTPRRPVKGESVIGTGFDLAMGGKGANQAMTAALLGAHVTMVGRVGNDNFGEMQIENMRDAGVVTDYISRDATCGTGCAGIMVDEDGDNSIVFIPQANNTVTRIDVDAAVPAIREAHALLVQLELPMKVTRHAIIVAKKLGVKVILDPAPACALEDFYFQNADIIKPNETEASLLSGIEVRDLDSAAAAARAIAAKGCKTVIITLGENGALLLDGEETAHIPAPKVKAVDTTAAGDAFSGALAVFLAEGKPIREAIRLAGFAGALAATKSGAQPSLPDREQLQEFIEKYSS